MKGFFIKQWFGILSFVLSIAFSSYIYLSSKIEREPVFISDPVRTLIANGNRAGSKKVNVVDENGKPIKGDVIAVRFNFWNEGRHPIKGSDILEDLNINLDGEDVKILDQSVIASTRSSVVKPKLSNINSVSANIDFGTLERNDGFSGQIIYAGDRSAKLRLSGDLEGVPENGIASDQILESRIFWRWYFPVVGIFMALIVAGIAVVALFTKLTNFAASKLHDRHKSQLQKLAKPIGVLAGVVFFFGYMAIVTLAMVDGKAINEMPPKLKESLIEASNKSIQPTAKAAAD
ncbi:hypothetical protein ACG1BZ_06275 [Microbulbifer sp. CNSA002]|uniref:hypothetical protein n=1 Tax=Microbulbifer sp. CNSA002 TaxID=3373604 RepID=UPI0039B5A394